MATTENMHSQVVGWAKILLPLCALALLSTLFLFARQSSETDALALAQAEEVARQQRVTAPEFAGVTDDGDLIVISAATAQPDADRPDTVQANDLLLRLDTTDGGYVEVTAIRGEVDGGANIARFLGLARLETSSGYEMETNGLIATLDTGQVTSDGLLEVRAPIGILTAGQVTFQNAADGSGSQLLFTNGVRLLYTPDTQPQRSTDP